MRIGSIAASLLLAVCVSTPTFAATDNSTRNVPVAASAKKRASEPLKPTWERCFDMSITRGFNHDTEEWQQSIQDCLAWKIPL